MSNRSDDNNPVCSGGLAGTATRRAHETAARDLAALRARDLDPLAGTNVNALDFEWSKETRRNVFPDGCARVRRTARALVETAHEADAEGCVTDLLDEVRAGQLAGAPPI